MKKIISLLLILCAALSALSISACAPADDGTASKYEIFVIYDEEKGMLTGTVALDYFNATENELNDLKFNLYGNAYREGARYSPVSATYENLAYYAGKNYGGMQIANVENCAGWTVSGEDENILVVNLTAPLYPDERIFIKISYTLTLAKINHRTGITQKTVNLGNFYPILCAYSTEGFAECPYYSIGDPFLSECADYKVTVDLPADYVAATSGQLDSETRTNDRKQCTYTLEHARDFAMVLSDKFEVISEDVDGVVVSYYHTSDSNAQVSLSAAADSIRYFSQTFGAYMYPTLSVVQTGFCYGGMEYPALTMVANALDSDSGVYTIVHENAHQWWYAMVGSDQLNCAWQDEGLAEYSTLMFFENHTGYGFTRTGLIGTATKSYRSFFSVLGQLNGTVDTSMSRRLDRFSGEYEYNNITYNKGLLLFETLRTSLGDDKFLDGLRRYFSKYAGKIASADDLCGSFLAGGTDVEGFFTSFIEGKVII